MGPDHHRQELARHIVNGDHAMRQARIVIDGVTLIQDFHMLADLDLEAAGKDQVHFLASMVVQFDLCGLSSGFVRRCDQERFDPAILEAIKDLPVGEIVPGAPADLCLLDTDCSWTVDPDKFVTMGRATPFAGWQVQGKNRLTVWRGEVVYEALR